MIFRYDFYKGFENMLFNQNKGYVSFLVFHFTQPPLSTCLKKTVFFQTNLIIALLCLIWASGKAHSICKAGSKMVFPGRHRVAG